MSVVASFTVAADSFLLDDALSAAPNTFVEAERLASHGAEWVFPYHWASGSDLDRFDAAVREDPTVDDAAVVEETDDSALYEIEWTDPVVELITEITDQHGSILEAVARGDEWRLELRFSEEGKVTTFQREFEERGRSFEVNRISRPTVARQQEYGLTAAQRETMVTALEAGYFAVPRDLTIEELAERLEVSSNAVSQRIRRGSANLVRHTLTVGRGRMPPGE